MWSYNNWMCTLSDSVIFLPIESHSFEVSGFRAKNTNHVGKIRELMKLLRKRLKDFHGDIAQLHSEAPQLFAGTRGTAAAGAELIHMAFMTGCLAQYVWEQGGEYHEHKVSEWKGNMSKDQTRRRITKILTKGGHELETIEAKLPDKSHAWDALGVGLYAQGVF